MSATALAWIPAGIHNPHILLYGHTDGARSRGRPRKRWLDNIKEDCAILQLTLPDADRLAKDRSGWRSLIHRTYGVGVARVR